MDIKDFIDDEIDERYIKIARLESEKKALELRMYFLLKEIELNVLFVNILKEKQKDYNAN